MADIEKQLENAVHRKEIETNQLLNCTVNQNEEILAELRILNEHKLKQLDNDVVFREMWQHLKASDRRTAYVMVLIACGAIFLDLVQLEDFYIIQQRLALLLEPITKWIGA